MPSTPVAATIAWRSWTRAAFDEARDERKLVLLVIGVPWSPACAALEAVEFARADLVDLVNTHAIAIRVDGCARPDISDRYVADGWPTVACLTPEGDPLCARTATSADQARAILARAIDGFDANRDALIERARQWRTGGGARASIGAPGPRADAASLDALVERILASADPEFGGFGEGPKIPHVAAIRLLLGAGARDPRCRDEAIATLDRVAAHLQDPADGGFFRAARARDWSEPDTAKLLDVNAELIELFADVGAMLDRDTYRDVASRAVQFVQDAWACRDGGFAASVRAGASAHDASAIDRTLYVDANALMARAYLRAGAALNQRPLVECAVRTLERVMVAAYQPGRGVAHLAEDPRSVRGLLGDQVHAAFALAESAASLGSVPHLMLAEELMHTADRTAANADGSLNDRVPIPSEDIGLLSDPLTPFALNCEAARVWLRLAVLAEKPAYRDRAMRLLTSQAPAVAARGIFAAPYGVALQELETGER